MRRRQTKKEFQPAGKDLLRWFGGVWRGNFEPVSYAVDGQPILHADGTPVCGQSDIPSGTVTVTAGNNSVGTLSFTGCTRTRSRWPAPRPSTRKAAEQARCERRGETGQGASSARGFPTHHRPPARDIQRIVQRCWRGELIRGRGLNLRDQGVASIHRSGGGRPARQP